MSNTRKKIASVLLFPMYWISHLFPRNRKIWAFGSYNNSFSDNSKHFFLYLNKHQKDIKSVWISGDKSLVIFLKSKGFKAFYRYSYLGIYYMLRAKYYFYSAYPNEISLWFSGNAVLINLWHGIPLKKIEFDIKKGKYAPRYNPANLAKKIGNALNFPEIFIHKTDYILSTCNRISEIFASAFKIARDQCLEIGYPRNDILFAQKNELSIFINEYESQECKHLIQDISKFEKVFVYMPTFRDNESNIFSQAKIDFNRLNQIMQESNTCFLIKLHGSTKEILANKYSNILTAGNVNDIYPLLPFTDILITDYSSIYFDYLFLDKEIIFFPFDYAEYISENREFYFDYEQTVPGTIVDSFEALIKLLANSKGLDTSYKRQKCKEMFWKHQDNRSSERLFDTIKEFF